MNEFELSTLIVVGLLLLGVGGYSYAQIVRAQRQVNAKRQVQLSDSPTVPALPERYHPQVQAPIMAIDDSEKLSVEVHAPVETFDRKVLASDELTVTEPMIALESEVVADVSYVADEINEAGDVGKEDETNSEDSPATAIESEIES